jgi:hypothetical protein
MHQKNGDLVRYIPETDVRVVRAIVWAEWIPSILSFWTYMSKLQIDSTVGIDSDGSFWLTYTWNDFWCVCVCMCYVCVICVYVCVMCVYVLFVYVLYVCYVCIMCVCVFYVCVCVFYVCVCVCVYEHTLAETCCGTNLTLRWLMSYIYGAPIPDVSR